MPLAVQLAQSGKRTAVIERHLVRRYLRERRLHAYQNLCRERAAHVARTAAKYGVVIDGDIEVDMACVKARKDEVIEGSRDGVEKWLRGTKNLMVFKGHARFTGPHALSVEDSAGATQDIDVEQIFINTGMRSSPSTACRISPTRPSSN